MQFLADRFFDPGFGLALIVADYFPDCRRTGCDAFAAAVAFAGIEGDIIFAGAVGIAVADFHFFAFAFAFHAVPGKKSGPQAAGQLRVGEPASGSMPTFSLILATMPLFLAMPPLMLKSSE